MLFIYFAQIICILMVFYCFFGTNIDAFNTLALKNIDFKFISDLFSGFTRIYQILGVY